MSYDLVPTLHPESLKQGAINTAYSGVLGALVGRYVFGDTIAGARVGLVGYPVVATGMVLYDWAEGYPSSAAGGRRPLSPEQTQEVYSTVNSTLFGSVSQVAHSSAPDQGRPTNKNFSGSWQQGNQVFADSALGSIKLLAG
jgi:hypothetical protein